MQVHGGCNIILTDVEDPEPDFGGYEIPLLGQDPLEGASAKSYSLTLIGWF